MKIEIITPEKKLFEGSILSVLIPGTSGEFEILNNHAPVISNLKSGKIRVIDENNQSLFFEINSGVIEMQNNKIIILAE